jgi:parallel beta-helix repeat protein
MGFTVKWPWAIRGAVLVACLVFASAALAGKGPHRPPSGIYVDNDKAQCWWAQYTTIQSAVDAAPAGSRITVCPGVYAENVTVNKSLTLLGPRAKGDVDQRSRCRTAPNPYKDAIIDPVDAPNPPPGVELAADFAKLIGFTVQGTTNNAGVHTSNQFSGYEVSRNVIRDNSIGLYPSSNGQYPMLVKQNCFFRNNNPGAAAGNGIYTDQGLANAKIVENRFTGRHENTSIIIIGEVTGATPTTNVLVAYNKLDNDNAIQFINVHNSRIICNSITNSLSNGIQVMGNTSDSVVALAPPGNQQWGVIVGGNTIRGSAGDGYSGINIGPGAGAGLAPATNVLIEHNTVRDFSGNGIKLNGDAAFNLVRRNTASGNDVDGLLAIDTTHDNTFYRNTAYDNAEHDCHDDTTGLLTAGSANTWNANQGQTQNRPGLCRNKKGWDARVVAPEYVAPVVLPPLDPTVS